MFFDFLLMVSILMIFIVSFNILWVAFIASSFYSKKLYPIRDVNIKKGTLILFYLIYSIALTSLVLLPAVNSTDILFSLYGAAIFGVACYSTYNLLNYSTLLKWPKVMLFVDIVSGVILTTISSFLTYLIFVFLI